MWTSSWSWSKASLGKVTDNTVSKLMFFIVIGCWDQTIACHPCHLLLQPVLHFHSASARQDSSILPPVTLPATTQDWEIMSQLHYWLKCEKHNGTLTRLCLLVRRKASVAKTRLWTWWIIAFTNAFHSSSPHSRPYRYKTHKTAIYISWFKLPQIMFYHDGSMI